MKEQLVISAKLKTRAALHVGSGQGSSEADALLRRDAAGEIFIPGSALGGALRAIATRLAPRMGSKVCETLQENPNDKAACNCMACRLFGEFYPQEENTEKKGGRASRLWVYDARLVAKKPPDESEALPPSKPWIRDGVGIDRATGAAARLERVKFDLEVLPAGTVFDLHLELEDASEEESKLLAAALAEWQAGRGAVGGRVARGLGAFDLEGVECRQRDLNEAESLMAYLRDEEAASLQMARKDEEKWLPGWVAATRASLKPAGDNPHVARCWVELDFTLQATGPFLVNDPTMAGLSGFDHAPLIEDGRPVLPGASLRGVLRSQAERIARTLATEQAENGAEFMRKCPACSPVARPRDQENVALECCDALLARLEKEDRRDALDEVSENELCLACQLFGSTRLGSRLIVADALFVGDKPTYKVQDFLAIDRFTGGGREGAKFDAAALWQPAFQARLRLENPRDWELGWLALVLRDLAEGWLTVGFGRAKGYGQVIVPKWTVRVGFIQERDFPLLSAEEKPDWIADLNRLLPESVVKPGHPSLYQVAEVRGQTEPVQEGYNWRWELENGDAQGWRGVIGSWVAAFNQQAAGFERGDAKGSLPPLATDTYFDGGLVERLYAKAGRHFEEVQR